MALVSPVLSQEWSFVSSFDTPNYSIELADRSPAIHSTKRRARDIEWDQGDEAIRGEVRTKKAKTSLGLSVDSHQLRKETETTPQPPLEQVLSIIVDALTHTCKSSSSASASISPELSQPTVSILAPAQPPRRKLIRPTPTSPLSDCPGRAPFARKTIGGSCAGKTEPDLCRWVLSRNHFLK